jgi:hypothetical protein
VDAATAAVLHWTHVFDHRGDARAHGCHVRLRHAVLLRLRLTTRPASPDGLHGRYPPGDVHD